MNKEQPIILVGPAHPLRGGIAHFNESFCRALKQEGYKCRIVSFYLQYPSILFPGKSQYAPGPGPDDLKITQPISSIHPLSWPKTVKEILSYNPQLVVIRFWHPFMGPSLGAIAKQLRKNGIKVIGLIDNAAPHEASPFDKLLSKRFFNNCSAFFTLSESVAKDLQVIAPSKPTATSPHPVYDSFGDKIQMNTARQNLGLTAEGKYVLFFGFIRPYKGLDLLLHAFGSGEVKKLNLKLLVAGEFYEERGKYDRIVKDNDLETTVEFHSDYIPDDKVREYFCASNLIAQTYKTATQSGVTQIAYHFERPMLVTDVGGLAEIVPDGKTGFVVPPEPGAIAAALVRFFKGNFENEFSAMAALEKKRFSWKHFVNAFLSFADRINE